jgi:Spy/CpxP family protein refolding chaperone
MHGPERFLDRHADRLGVDADTRAAIQQIVDASAADGERLRAEHEAAREKLHGLLEAEEPDRDAVMAQIDTLGAIHVAERKHRMDTMLRIRALLTPEQRREMVEIRDEFKQRRGDWKSWKKHRGGGPGSYECPHECDGSGVHDCPYGGGKHECPYGDAGACSEEPS